MFSSNDVPPNELEQHLLGAQTQMLVRYSDSEPPAASFHVQADIATPPTRGSWRMPARPSSR